MMQSADPVFRAWVDHSLVWLPERGMGYLDPGPGIPYDEAYFENYVRLARTSMGEEITAGRVALVAKHMGTGGLVVDVGIGCGAFIEGAQAAGMTARGYDIAPAGRRWLEDNRLWLDPYTEPVDAATFWDCVEHIPDPAPLLRNVRTWAFVSLPTFTGPDHVLNSKHYKPGEHCWYWTRDGLIRWMGEHGFRCVEHGTPESLLGREDIHTFVFRRSP